MKGILSIFERRRLSILSAVFLAMIFLQVQAAPGAAADNYSAAEKIYLKTVTPILYEYSQVASQVSANVLPLQSAPLEKCSGEFAHYYGIMSSLGKQLGTITPPARFESVQANSASAISEYETSLNLYSAACTQEDFGMKEELVSRAGAGVNRSVATISRVYKEIEDLGSVAAAPPAADGAASENLSESAIETAPSGEAVEEVYVEEQAVEVAPPPAPTTPPAPKTREEVIQNLAEEVDTRGTEEVQKTAPAAPVVEAPKPAAAPAVKAPEPVKPAPAEAQTETAKIETSEETLPLPPPPAEPAPVETKKLPEPEKPEAVQAKPEPAPDKPAPAPVKALPVEEPAVPKVEQAPLKEAASVPAPAAETAAVPAPAAPEKPAPAPEPTLTPAPQEGAATAEVGPQPPKPGDAASETVTEKSMDTAALAPEDELKEEALPEDEISSWCSRYQTDFEREACVKKRTAARDKAGVLTTSFEDGTPEKEIVEKCRADWKEGITYNYEMVVSCTQFFCGQKGLEACKELAK